MEGEIQFDSTLNATDTMSEVGGEKTDTMVNASFVKRQPVALARLLSYCP